MFWFRMNNIRDNRQASRDERCSSSSSIEIFQNPIGTINIIHKIYTAAITELAFEAVKSSSNYLTSSSEQRESVKVFLRQRCLC